ncbi:protein PGR-like [Curcuma longa]|uniref:protein PGR-like n=1 Tax=Curcuma longa TaxID=136217 RepID=UPI003D9F0049
MEGFPVRTAVAVALALAIATRSFRHRSLDLSGAITGFLVMAIHIAAGYRFGALLLVFFFTSSKLTKMGEEKKRKIDEEFKEGGQRNWIQVLANSGLATILVVVFVTVIGGQDTCLDTKRSKLFTGLIGGIIGHYACCNGDTWSSEIGLLSNAQPRLITTFKTVRKGTNGAVSVEGLLAAAAAGLVIGLTSVITGSLAAADCSTDAVWKQLLLIPIATIAGLGGSLIDSLLGATLQFSGYCTVRKKVVSNRAPTVIKISGMSLLDNNAVNAVSVLLTSFLTSAVCLYIF